MPADGGLRRRLRRAVSGSACGGPASLRTVRWLQVSLLTVRRRAAPSAGGSGGVGGIAYLRWRLRQAGAGSVRRGLELGAEVGRRLRWDLAALKVMLADAPVSAPPEGNAKEVTRHRRRMTTTVSSNDDVVATGSYPAA